MQQMTAREFYEKYGTPPEAITAGGASKQIPVKMTRKEYEEKYLSQAAQVPEPEKKPSLAKRTLETAKAVGKGFIGGTKALGADILNILTPWRKPKESVQAFGETYETPSKKGKEAGTFTAKGEYKKAAGKMGEALLDVASIAPVAGASIKALKAGSILRGAIQASSVTAPFGALYGATTAMGEGKTAKEIGASTLAGGVVGGISGGILGAIPGTVKATVQITSKALATSMKKIEEVIGKLTTKEVKIIEDGLQAGKEPEIVIQEVLDTREPVKVPVKEEPAKPPVSKEEPLIQEALTFKDRDGFIQQKMNESLRTPDTVLDKIMADTEKMVEMPDGNEKVVLQKELSKRLSKYRPPYRPSADELGRIWDKAHKSPFVEREPAKEPLLQEARKYKSAEEFVKAHYTPDSYDLTPGKTRLERLPTTGLYHGAGRINLKSILSDGKIRANVSKLDNAGERVVSLSGNRGTAGSYGVVFELDKKLPVKEPPAGTVIGDYFKGFEYRHHGDIPLDKVKSVHITLNKGEGLDAKIMWEYKGKNPEYITARELKKKFEDKGIKVFIDNNGAFSSKSQLSAIWKKAQEVQKPPAIEGKKTSIIAERLNKDLPADFKFDETYDPKVINKESEKAASLIATNKKEAIRRAMNPDTNPMERDAILIELSEIAKRDKDYSTLSDLFQIRSELIRGGAQSLNMEKASILLNPQEKYMRDIVNSRLANLKISEKELKSAAKKTTEEVKTITKKAFKVRDAQQLFDSLICK